ncbi:MAG: hypothetical protein JWP47_1106 [Polaromonas sp.]|nr:hypothetical protein [Polaromonas sp.]
MNIPIGLPQPAWPGLLAVALMALVPFSGHAQPDPAPTHTTGPAQAQPANELTLPAFRSALDGYQPYSEEKTLDWKLANEQTARIGGWRAYAREASSSSEAGSSSAAPAPTVKP